MTTYNEKKARPAESGKSETIRRMGENNCLLNKSVEKLDIKICSRCIYDERVDGIIFDSNGVCNYCHQIDKLKQEYGTGKEEGKQKLSEIITQIKAAGKGKKYDCVIGVSGGTDSSYTV